MKELRSILIELIDEPELKVRVSVSPREFERLKASIDAEGVKQPLLVRPKGNRFEVMAGVQRLRVLKELGRREAPCVIMDASNKEAFKVQLLENYPRLELDPISLAESLEAFRTNFGLDISELCNLTGLSPPVNLELWEASQSER